MNMILFTPARVAVFGERERETKKCAVEEKKEEMRRMTSETCEREEA